MLIRVEPTRSNISPRNPIHLTLIGHLCGEGLESRLSVLKPARSSRAPKSFLPFKVIPGNSLRVLDYIGISAWLSVYLPAHCHFIIFHHIPSYSIIFYPSITSSFHLSLYLSIDPSISFSISIIIHLYSSVMICRHLCASASLSLSLFVIYT